MFSRKTFLLILVLSLWHSSFVEGKKTSECKCLKSEDKCDCSGLKLATVPKSILNGVKELNLSNNRISNVTIIPETSSLEKLDLSSNGVVSLDYDAFDNLDYLKILILSNNKIDKIGDDIFEWNPLTLKVIHLDNNKLEFVQHFLFYDLTDLFEIDLSHNEIAFIHPHAFGQQKSLVTLKLNNNHLQVIDKRWMSTFSPDYLNLLDLSENKFSCDCLMADHVGAIRKTSYVSKYLETLVCSKGASVNKTIFNVDVDEMKAVCEAPRITGISKNSVVKKSQTIKLRCVTSESSPPATIMWKAPNGDSYNYHNADKFEGIEAHPNGVLKVSNFRKVDEGDYLCVASNKKGKQEAKTTVTFLDEETDDASSTRDLEQTDNVKTTNETFGSDCPENCKCLSGATDCASQKLTEIPSLIPHHSFALNFEVNNLKVLKSGLLNYNEMTLLRFDDNEIVEVEEGALDGVYMLKTLSFRNNKLRSFPKHLFKKLIKLDKLVLDNNLIETLDQHFFEGLEELAWLYIRNNRIAQIEEGAFQPLKVVEYIHLESNLLHAMSLESVQELTEMEPEPRIKRVFVNNNDFFCDCHMKELHGYLTSEGNNETWKDLFGDGMICGFPATVYQQKLVDLNSSILICDGQLIAHKTVEKTSRCF